MKVLCVGKTKAYTFQNIVNDVLKVVASQVVLDYLDNILIKSRSKVEHILHLNTMLELLHSHMPYAKLFLRKFATSELMILGHSAKGVEVDPAKTSELCTACCTSAAEKTKKDTAYSWTKACGAALTGVKNA